MGCLRYVSFKDLDEARQKEFIAEAERIFKQNGIEVDDIIISWVEIGNASEPYILIHVNGITLYDETNSPPWAKGENTKRLRN
jgi:hypothetical protein